MMTEHVYMFYFKTKGRIALEPDISNVPGQTPQDLALSLSADNLSVVHAPSH